MAQLAIKGHKTRGNEVIEILEMLGGKNDRNYSGELLNYVYTINEYGIIDWYLRYNSFQYVTFTIEEFLEKFPYRVGDKVIDIKTNKVVEIYKAHWSESNNCTYYDIKRPNNTGYVRSHKFLQPYKEETVEEKLEQITLDIPAGYGFFGINDNNKVVLTKKQPQYPTTYEECCEVLFPNSIELGKVLTSGYNCEKLKKFGELLICRDAYWKIAGEQMGLCKPWEPEFRFGKKKYCIMTEYNKVTKATVEETNRFLVFPTEEMRDEFYEDFKDLIESCKELL